MISKAVPAIADLTRNIQQTLPRLIYFLFPKLTDSSVEKDLATMKMLSPTTTSILNNKTSVF